MKRFPVWCVGLAVVLAMRGLYLACFGADGSWMNWNYLVEAKFFLTGLGQPEHGPPLTALVLVALRAVGLDALAAVALAYLTAHTLVVLGTLGLARFLWPNAGPQRQLTLCLVVAIVPMLSSGEGYTNLAPLLGTGLLVTALSLAATASVSPARRILRLAGAALLACLAAACRFEAVTGLASAAFVLLACGRRWAGLRGRLVPAATLAAGAALGVVATFLLRSALSGVADTWSASYPYYTFFDGLPLAMWPMSLFEQPTEYARYAASLHYFGSFAENGGSVLNAIASHPGAAALRFVAKLPDIAGTLFWTTGATPLGFAVALLGLRRLREGGRGAILLAYGGVLLPLLVPTPWTGHLAPLAPPLCLAASCGLERALVRLRSRAAALVGAGALAAGALALAYAGGRPPATAGVVNQAAPYLEALCREGCLTNFLPQALAAQVWSDMEAGSPLPRKCKTCEEFALRRHSAAFRRGCRFSERLLNAGPRGGPSLYIDVRTTRAQLFDEDFDPERRYEGPVDLSRATVLRRFREGQDELVVYRLEGT